MFTSKLNGKAQVPMYVFCSIGALSALYQCTTPERGIL